jgi:MoaA/NifB/PqqE/SkfB family radical SAM enzyme
MDINKLKKSKTFCPFPFMNLNNNTNGSLKLCCAIFKNDHIKMDDGVEYKINEDNFDEAWNSNYMKSVRTKMRDGKFVSECVGCYNLEQSGVESTRETALRDYLSDNGHFVWMRDNLIDNIVNTSDDGEVDGKILSLELRLGNHCNLKCMMCWGYSSSKVNNERLVLLEKKDIPYWLSESWQDEKSVKKENMLWYEDEKFLNNFKKIAPNLKRLYVTGGEPTINKALEDMIQILVDSNNDECYVSWTTNLTTWNERLYNNLKFFKRAEVQVSIDGFEKSNSYIRAGSTWNDIKNNFEKLILLPENVKVQVYSVLQFMNTFELGKLIYWLKNLQYSKQVYFWPIVLEQPLYMRTKVVPKNLRDDAIKKYKKLLKIKNQYLPNIDEGIERIIKTLNDDWNSEPMFGDFYHKVKQTQDNQLKMFFQQIYFTEKNTKKENFVETFSEFEDLYNEYRKSIGINISG